MCTLLGLLLLGADPAGPLPDARARPEFDIEIRIVEFEPIEGVTKQDPRSEDHLHVKPLLVVTPAEVASVRKRRLRGPTIGTKETGFQHYPRLVVEITLTAEAKLRLKKAVEPTTTSGRQILATVVDDEHDGSWSKYFLNDPVSPSHWNRFGLRIGCRTDAGKADRLIEYLNGSRAKHTSQSR